MPAKIPPSYLTRAQFARHAGVGPQRVSVLTAGQLEPALVLDGRRIDISHPCVVRYMKARSAREHAKDDEPSTQVPNVDPTLLPENIQHLADWPLRKIVQTFGTSAAFVDWLKATKLIEDIHAARLKNDSTSGELVSRDLVSRGLIEPIETAFVSMLSDGARTIAARSVAMVRAGSDEADIEDLVKDQLSSLIRPAKAKIKRNLGGMRD